MPNYVSHIMIPLNDAAKACLIDQILKPNGFSFENIVPGRPTNGTWYKWCLKNWGTKWDAINWTTTHEGRLHFDTAWTTSTPIFEAIARQYPDAEFRVIYVDEDLGQNLGIHFINHGRVQSDHYEGRCLADKINLLNEMQYWGVVNWGEDKHGRLIDLDHPRDWE